MGEVMKRENYEYKRNVVFIHRGIAIILHIHVVLGSSLNCIDFVFLLLYEYVAVPK